MDDSDYMKCHFCNQPFDLQDRQPRMIFDCGHSICQESLEKYFSSSNKRFTCPLDNIRINLDNKTIDVFPIN